MDHEFRIDGFHRPGLAVIMMGVSGAGKTTIGEQLARALDCPFFDADDFHSQHNKEKMRAGIPLTDDDRRPWLDALKHLLHSKIVRGEMVVLACSALKKLYRDSLRTADPALVDAGGRGELRTGAFSGSVLFVYLQGSYELFMSRVAARHKEGHHYMPPSLLQSQIQTLEMEEKEEGIFVVDANQTPDKIVEEVTRHIAGRLGGQPMVTKESLTDNP